MNLKTRILYGFLVAFDIAKLFFLAYLSVVSIFGTRHCSVIHTPIIGYFVFLMFVHCLEICGYEFEKSDNSINVDHSSEIRGLRSTKCSSETLQNLLYFIYKKTHVVFFVFHFVQLYIFTL